MTDRLQCEVCDMESCTCPPCDCKWCADRRGEATDFQKRQIKAWMADSLQRDLQERIAKREPKS